MEILIIKDFKTGGIEHIFTDNNQNLDNIKIRNGASSLRGNADSIFDLMDKNPDFAFSADKKYPFLTFGEFIADVNRNYGMTRVIQNAVGLCYKAHFNQKRDDSTAYINEHILPVTQEVFHYFLRQNGADLERAVCVPLLHDTVEDNINISFDDVLKATNKNIAYDVRCLTEMPVSDEGLSNTKRSRLRRELYLTQLREGSIYAKITTFSDHENNTLCMPKSPNKHKQVFFCNEVEKKIIPLAMKTSDEFYHRLLKAVYCARKHY